MPGRLQYFPALAGILLGLHLGFATNAAAEDTRTSAQVLDTYGQALGPRERIRTLRSKSTFFSGRERMSGVRTHWGEKGEWKRVFRRTPEGQRVDYFGEFGAVLYAGRARARYWPGELKSRAWYYALSALARPFALSDYVGNDKAQAGLTVGVAHGYDVLATSRDAFGVRTLYFVDRTTGHLAQIRFEAEDDKPFATLQFERYAAVDGVLLPHLVVIELRLMVEDEIKRGWKESRVSFKERIDEWTINPEGAAEFALPAPPATLPKGFRRSVHTTVDDPADLVVADLDRDGKSDIAVAGTGGVAIHFGGALAKPLRIPLGEGEHRGCRVTDLNLDGVPELVVMSWTRPSDMFFLISFPKGRAPKIGKIFAAPNCGYALAVDDFDRDGIPDLVASGYASRDVGWKFGNGAGGVRIVSTAWKLLVNKRDPRRAYGLSVGDVNGDGLREVAVAEPDRPRVVIFQGESNLSFQPRYALTDKNVGLIRPVDVCFADLNGDGRDDLLVAQEHPVKNIDGDIGVMLNTGHGLKVAGYLPAGERVFSVRAADLDGDGHNDVIATSFLTDQLVWLRGKGDGSFEKAQFAGVARGPIRAEVGDVDGDGRPDVVVASRIDGAITILHNSLGKPAAVATHPATRIITAFREGEAKITGLSEEYEFAGEWRLPAEIRDPSGIAFLHQDPASTGLVVVSDKVNALYRVTLEHARDRLLVAPALPLSGAPASRFDLEGVAFDRHSGSLFIACETDNTILRTTLFGDILGRAKTGIPLGDNDGIEGVALRRKRDGTPLLYLLKERIATTAVQPPVFAFELGEKPFALTQRGAIMRLPVPMVDQTGATVDGERLFVVSRFARSIAEVEFAGDGFAKEFKVAGYRAVTERILGYPKLPAFGMVEAITRAVNGDLYLLVDTNGVKIGHEGRNRGSEGRLIRLRCTTPQKVARSVDRVHLQLIFLPFAGAAQTPNKKRTRNEALALAQKCAKEARGGADFEALRRRFHDIHGTIPNDLRVVRRPAQPKPNELDQRRLPAALFRLAFELAIGETEVCEYDPQESPWGYYVVRRVE